MCPSFNRAFLLLVSSPTNCDIHLAESNFQTCFRKIEAFVEDIRIYVYNRIVSLSGRCRAVLLIQKTGGKSYDISIGKRRLFNRRQGSGSRWAKGACRD
jgi:hypothetical protein